MERGVLSPKEALCSFFHVRIFEDLFSVVQRIHASPFFLTVTIFAVLVFRDLSHDAHAA